MYVKLFASILDSSVWSEDQATRLVWITMLAMADEAGIVRAAVPGLSRRAGVSIEECRRALGVLSAPDAESRSPEHEGRRIQGVAGGWLLLNYEKYREIQTNEQALAARRMREWRRRQRAEEEKNGVTGSTTPPNVRVTDTSRLQEAEAKGEAEAPPTKPQLPARRDNSLKAVQEHLASVDAETLLRLAKEKFRRMAAELIFAYWCRKLNHPAALLDEHRERPLLKAMLASRDNGSDLLHAIDGAVLDEWASVEVGRHDIPVLFRDRAHIEKYLTTARYKRGEVHPVWLKYVDPNAHSPQEGT